MMTLRRFRVEMFRSVRDSGWIDCDTVTTMVGINEAGKSNLLLALWKLNPAGDGSIDLLADLPRDLYNKLRDADDKPAFITAEFGLDSKVVDKLAAATGAERRELCVVRVQRTYDESYAVSFPDEQTRSDVPALDVREVLERGLALVGALEEAGKGEAGIKDQALEALREALSRVAESSVVSRDLEQLIGLLAPIESKLKGSKIAPAIMSVQHELGDLKSRLDRPRPSASAKARELVVAELPLFVYYSNYGNLDSEIYLPHVIENLGREDLSGTTAAKTRTLRILFDFVGLNAREILEKGKEPEGQRDGHGAVVRPPTSEQIEQSAEAKRERDVLLHSASTRLTKEFREWWRQGRYVFDLAADGHHFRIWVSDDERPAKVELEHRSTGLQWFLSFFLVFLVESEEAHKGAVLLLDEAGMSLHPLAQQDLVAFFDNLSRTNQILHTTHSPFLISTDHVDRVKVVYVDDSGHTVASSDLRAGEKDPRQSKSVYAVHAALGMTVSEVLLQGCHPVIVEGASDQYYLSAMKTLLVGQGYISPPREIVFAPAGGVRGVTGVAGLMAAKEEELPFVLVDSDKSGQDLKKRLISGLYSGLSDRLVEVNQVLGMANAEVEDLIPSGLLLPILSRVFRDVDGELLEDVLDAGKPIVPQVEAFAERHDVHLQVGWKVDVARQVKARLLQQGVRLLDKDTVDLWTGLMRLLYPSLVTESGAQEA